MRMYFWQLLFIMLLDGHAPITRLTCTCCPSFPQILIELLNWRAQHRYRYKLKSSSSAATAAQHL